MTESLPAVVLAAGRITDGLARATGVDAKGLIPVGGKPIIDSVLEAIAQAKLIGDVRVVCAPSSSLVAHVGEAAVESHGPGFLDSVTTGLEAVGRPDRILLITGDLPALTGEALDHFCRQALQSDSSIVYSMVRKEASERAFPGGRRTYIPLTEGVYTGGNVGALSREFIEKHGDRISEAFAARKNPLRLCGMLGWGFVLRLLMGRLSAAEVAVRAEAVLGMNVSVVDSPFAEIGFDVDKPANLATAEAWLSAQTTP